METLCIKPWEEDGVLLKEEGQEKSPTEASSPTGSTTGEETDEDSEPEPPPVVRRKVSFADAFGLNLVSVKEFDNAEETESDVSLPPEREATLPLEEFYMSCLFTVPSSSEELDHRLQAQMVELESIELLPGTTTIRGTVRVVNLCFSKSVYARMSLDHWVSYFDLLAEYVPGSSDRKSDRFSFKYTLVPPFERGGTRVDICLRYETSVGTFWANNNDMNYVLFCHQRGHVHEPYAQEESASYKSKRSCLKAHRRGSTDEKTRDTSNTSTLAAELGATDKAEGADRKTIDSTKIQSLLHHKEHKPLVDSVKSRRRATRLARVQDFFSQRRHHVPEAYSHDSCNGQKVSQPLPVYPSWCDSASFLQKHHKKQSSESPQVLTYHEIPLLTLDWNNHQRDAAHMDDIWTGKAKTPLSHASVQNIVDTPSVNDMWEAFLNSTDDTADIETPVCDIWQAFLNGPSCTDHAHVPESEWLQTAASVSPSNDNGAKTKYAARSQEHEFQVDTPADTSAARQLLSETFETSLSNAILNAADHQRVAACVSSPRDDNTATQDASQRSETNSVTDTLEEFSLEGATPVSEGSVDSSSKCHMREKEGEGIIEGAEGTGRDEPSSAHTADLVTSSGESETTDMTAMPESQNASAVDRISQGASLAEGLSSSREGQVTGTAHNTTDDTLAFKGTIRQGTKDGERFVFSTSRQGAEEGMASNYTENRISTEEEIFRPQKTEVCEISQRYADEKQCEELRLNRNSGNPLVENESDENETRPAQSHADEFNPSQSCNDNFKQSRIMASEFKLEESENAASNNEDLEEFRKAEVEPSYCTTGRETKRLIGAEVGIIQVLNEEAWQRNDEGLPKRNKSIISKAHNEQSRPIQAEEEEVDSKLTQMQENVGLKYGKFEEQQDVTAQATKTNKTKQVFHGDLDTFRPFPTDKYNPNPVELVEMRQTHSQDDTKGQKEDAGREISLEEVTEPENVAKNDTSTELQRQAETLERIEEDMSQRDKDERVSIGKLKIEAPGELMVNVGNPQGERRNAPAQLKEQELSAEVESSPRVECKKLSEGTKDPITAENTVALEEIESQVEGMFIERFEEDLVRGISEEVFDLRAQASSGDTNIVEGMVGRLADTPGITLNCHHLTEKDLDEAFDSGVFSMTELPSDPTSSLCQGPEQTLVTESDEYFPNERSQSLITTETQADSNSSAHLSQDLILAALSRQLLTESAQSSSRDQENYTQIRERSVTNQETGRQIAQSEVAHKDRFNQFDYTAHKHLRSSSEKLKESNSFVWWSILYVLGHIIKLIVCILLVAGFFFVVFLYDFPTFFAFYIFSLTCWFYMWKKHRVTANKRVEG